MGASEDSRNGEQVMLTIFDKHTVWMDVYPAKVKTADEVATAFKSFFSGKIPKRVYTDGAKEFEAGFRSLGFSHDVSLPYNLQSNDLVENMICRLKEGTRKMLVQYFCMARNICDL